MSHSYRIFIDESRQVCDQYMVLGGLITTLQDLETVQREVAAFRSATNMHRELKWTKVSKGMYGNYSELVDRAESLITANMVHFKSLIVDTHTFNHAKFSSGCGETTFYKLMYQLIVNKFGEYLQDGSKAVIHLDQRSSRYSLEDLKPILNAGIRKKYEVDHAPIRSLDPVDSKTSDPIQIADILMGAIGFEMNGYHLKPGASPAKCNLARHIATRMRLRNLSSPTQWGRKDFEMWHFQFRSKQ